MDFQCQNGQERWKALSSDYFAELDKLGIDYNFLDRLKSLDWEKYGQLVSFPYLHEFLRWLGRPREYYLTKEN